MAEVVPPRPALVSRSSTTSNGIATSDPRPEAPLRNATINTQIGDTVRSNVENARESRPSRDSGLQPPTSTMNKESPIEEYGSGGEPPAIDPISRQILQRTQSQHKMSPKVQNDPSSYAASGPSDDTSGGLSAEPSNVRRVDSTASSKLGKDKKKGVSFLSRIMGGKKKEEPLDVRDSMSEPSDNRPAGNDAELFSQPVGFIPRFPAPPKYIKVKTQNRKQKDFDRLFVAQILLGGRSPGNRRVSVDAKIHSIDDAPQVSAATLSKSASNAIWAMEFSKDGKYLAAAGQDKKLRVWEVMSSMEDRETDGSVLQKGKDGQEVVLNAPVFKSKVIWEYDGHTSSILDLSWSKNNFLLSSSMDKTVRLYHVSRAECLCAFRHNDFVTSIQFHPRDDRFFLAGSLDSKLRLWSIPDKTVAYFAQVPDMVTAVAFTPDGKTAIAGCLNGLCILYDTEGLKAHSQIHVKSSRGRNTKGSKITGIDTINGPRENAQPDVKLLITSNDSRVRMYNLKDRNLEIKFRGNENSCSQIHATFSDDGKYVICGSEDRKVYMWPTEPTERPENDKRPVEIFEAHSSIVTSALLAPMRTRRLLAQSGDPLYDLCNPPPVTLLSRAESIISSKAPTNHSAHSEERPTFVEASRQSESPKRAPEAPAYLARHSHPGGQILVTADYTGQIKVFRQDCAFQKRRQESWDSNTAFSRKMLGRSGSVVTRNSGTSSNRRNSLNLGSKNQSADRIINWRNSITSNGNGNGNSATNSMSDFDHRHSLASTDRPRSESPKKSFSKRLSIRKFSTASHDPPPSSTQQPKISVQSPMTPESPRSFQSATANEKSSTSPSKLRPIPSNPTAQDFPHSANDPLFQMDEQSFMAWNVKNTLIPMAKNTPRSPGLIGPDGNPISRSQSYVSQLSSDLMSSAGEEMENVNGDDEDGKIEDIRQRSPIDDDLKCPKCGNMTFRATLADDGQQKLRCKKCGTIL